MLKALSKTDCGMQLLFLKNLGIVYEKNTSQPEHLEITSFFLFLICNAWRNVSSRKMNRSWYLI